jgi:hypothetical protein
MQDYDRRQLLAALGAAAAVAWLPEKAMAAPGSLVMWRDPGCGCCLEWAKRVEAAFGRKMTVIQAPDMASVKRAQGVPAELRSCHTALIQGVVVEGHVPPADVKRLIAARARGVKGLAVPGMPAGSPGMDVGHDHRQSYKVFAFGPGRKPTVFASHG